MQCHQQQYLRRILPILHPKRWNSTTTISITEPLDLDLDDHFVHSSSSSTPPTPHKSINKTNHQNPRPIYVSATREHVGKTTTCLALISGLTKRFPQSIGYIKPVGQRHVPVHSDRLEKEIRVDKDVKFIREHCQLRHLDFSDMSPVLIPQGYTKEYIDGKISHEEQLMAIETAVMNIQNENEVVLCEGTGHCGVGSIVGASNARVASLIGADMVLVANGGLGSCFDELELNRNLCKQHGVRVAGVIINKVMPAKYEQTMDYMGRALMQTWGIPLLGCIPDKPYLGCPALSDLERLFNQEMITGQCQRFQHYTIDDINLVTTSLTRFLKNMREKPSRTLYLCHVTRDDIILGFLAEAQRRKRSGQGFEAALVICGRKDKYSLSKELMDMIMSQEAVDVPILFCPHTTHQAMEMIHGLTPKLNSSDVGRVKAAVAHYEQYINFNMLLQETGNPSESMLAESIP